MTLNERPVVAITFRADESRAVLEETLGDLAELRYLAGLEDSTTRLERAKAADILFCLGPRMELGNGDWRSGARWRFIQTLSAGVDHVPLERLPPGIPIACNAGGFADAMAEHILAMVLALTKKLLPKHQALTRGEFDQLAITGTLRGKTCGILGFGGIGKETARLLRFLDVRIEAINSSGTTDEEVVFCGTLQDLEEVMRRADVLLVALPLTHTTENLIRARELAWLKPDAMIINVARGEIIDQQALYEHLRNNPDASAGIDAWWVEPFRHGEFRIDFPFFELPNVLGSPHNSPRVPDGNRNSVRHAAENIARFIQGETPASLVDRQRHAYG